MGMCVFCGKPAGFLHRQHKACAQRHAAGRDQISGLFAGALSSPDAPDAIKVKAKQVATESFVADQELKSLAITGWSVAVEHCLDGVGIDAATETKLVQLEKAFELTQADLDVDGSYSRVAKAVLLRDISAGKMPQRVTISGPIQINLQKNERIIWLFNGAQLLEDKTVRQYVGGSSGISVRVAKGFYVRSGAFRGHSVAHTERVLVDSGQVFVTDKNIYFVGPRKSVRSPYQKIVSFQPFSDGIGLIRDTANAKCQVLKTGDGWFTFNLVTSLSHFESKNSV